MVKQPLEREFYSITEFIELTGLSRQGVWMAVKEGRIKSSRVGRKYLIHRSVLDEVKVNGIGEKGIAKD